MLIELKNLIKANPLFCDKLQFPNLKNSRLRTLINQSLNWQHHLCKNPRPNPDIKTLFVDHICGQPKGAQAPSPVTNPLMSSIPKVAGFPPLGTHGPFQPAPAPLTTSLARWMASSSSVPHQTVTVGPMGLTAPNNGAVGKNYQMLAGEIAFSTSTLKRLVKQSANDHDSLKTQIQNLECEIQEKRRQMRVLEQHITKSGEASVANASMVDMQQTGMRLMTQCNEKGFELEVKVWNAQEKKCIRVLLGHTGSVKSLCSHPMNPNLVVSGSRDGSFALWDLRCNSSSKSRHGKFCISSTVVVKGAHLSPQAKQAASMGITSVTSVIFLLSIATAGAVDSVVKFWDTRNL